MLLSGSLPWLCGQRYRAGLNGLAWLGLAPCFQMECHLGRVAGVLAQPFGEWVPRAKVFDPWQLSEHLPAFRQLWTSAEVKVFTLVVLFTRIVTAVQNEMQWQEMGEWH